jgi:glycine cleavage system H protein
MTHTETAKRIAKSALLYLALTVALVAALPLLAGLAYGVRLVIPVLIVGALVALAISPKIRRWFVEEADNSVAYHGLAFPTSSLFVHPAHAWANVDLDGGARVGADALALAALGQVSAIETPSAGAKIAQGQPLFTLVQGQRRLAVKAPLSGVVAEVNEDALAQPSLLNQHPYGTGWVVRLGEVKLRDERGLLRRGQALRRWWRGEVDRLTMALAPAGVASTMADGGVLASDLSAGIDDGKWAELSTKFFT